MASVSPRVGPGSKSVFSRTPPPEMLDTDTTWPIFTPCIISGVPTVTPWPTYGGSIANEMMSRGLRPNGLIRRYKIVAITIDRITIAPILVSVRVSDSADALSSVISRLPFEYEGWPNTPQRYGQHEIQHHDRHETRSHRTPGRLAHTDWAARCEISVIAVDYYHGNTKSSGLHRRINEIDRRQELNKVMIIGPSRRVI